MIRGNFLLLGLAALLMFFGCQPTKKGQSGGHPKCKTIVITDSLFTSSATDTLRLGRLYSGEQLLFRFQLHNQSSRPQLLLGHEITCGCIALNYEHKPFMPNDYLPLELQFDSRGLYGWQLKLFRLHLHEAESALTLYVEAEVE